MTLLYLINYKNVILDYKPCVCPAFSLLVQTHDFYAKSCSLYAKVSLIFSKWPDFYAEVLVWVSTRERRSVCPSWVVVGGGCCALKARCAKLGGGVDPNG